MQFTTGVVPATLSSMRNDRHPATAAPTLRLERLVAFSDAVLAIAITLLVLGLDVPSVHKIPETQLPEYLVDSIPSVLAYITSFFLVGTYCTGYSTRKTSETHLRRGTMVPGTRVGTPEEVELVRTLSPEEVAKRTGRGLSAAHERRRRLSVPDGRCQD
jgi:hypothetical protein